MLRKAHHATTQRTRHSPPVKHRKASTQSVPVDKLKQAIRSASVEPDPGPKLRQLRQGALYEEVWQTSNAPAHAARRDPEATRLHERLAAEAFTICHALDAVTRLSDAYRLTLSARGRPAGSSDNRAAEVNDHTFLEQITTEHMKKLVADFHRSWGKNDDIRQAAILSALGPECAARLELTSNAAHREHAQAWGTRPPRQQLTISEVLALIDYVHSGTGTFNAVNGTAMAAAYYGDKSLSGLMTVFSTALDGAVAKLCEHPYFGQADIVTYKGINLKNPSGRFRLEALEAAIGTGKLVAFPSVLSTTADPEQSYAVQKYFQGYTMECRVRMEKAFDADPFHDEMTMGEKEVIGPAGQRFVVVEKQTVESFQLVTGRNEAIDRYILEPATQRLR
jgi:hypothetical protein